MTVSTPTELAGAASPNPKLMEAAVSSAGGESAGELLLRAAALVPWTRYVLAALALAAALLYRFLELHFLGDLLRGLRGGRVSLTFHPDSQVYHRVASKCRSLHGRCAGMRGMLICYHDSRDIRLLCLPLPEKVCFMIFCLPFPNVALRRYLATPWLASPHLQTLFLSISGRPPSFTYGRLELHCYCSSVDAFTKTLLMQLCKYAAM